MSLAFPLESGRYLVINGGSNISTNAHLETLDAGVPRYRAWRGQSYGVDLVELDGFGLRARGVQPADPRAYRIYGARVLAPCAGQVVIAVNGLPDMRVPEIDSEHLAGNHVMLRCAARRMSCSATRNREVSSILDYHTPPGASLAAADAMLRYAEKVGE